MAQDPFKNAFRDAPVDNLYRSPERCDVLSKTYCITQDYSLQFFTQSSTNIDSFAFTISPEVYLR